MIHSALTGRLVSLAILLAITFGTGCAGLKSKVSVRIPASETAQLTEQDIAVQEFQELIEEALVWRALAMKYAPILTKASDEGHLKGDQIQALHDSGAAYLDLRRRIFEKVSESQWIADKRTIVTFAPGTGTTMTERRKTTFTNLQLVFGKRKMLNLDPSDAEGRKHLIDLKISLAAALALYDNYLLGVYPYWENRRIRYLLDKDHEKANQLRKVTKSYLNKENRRQVARALAIIEKDLAWKAENNIQSSESEQYLEMLIQQSPTYSYLDSGAFKKSGPKREEAVFASVTEDLGFLGKAFGYITSKLFGNTMGLVEFRKGYLTHLTKEERDSISNALQPLDVLLEKTPFRLTDKFIPGHYGHVAIWVGNEEQLKAIGAWEDEAVKPHHEAIRSGHMIVEALRPGVEINTLEHFLNIDDFAALRHKSLTDEQRREYVIRTFQQIGKAYDFNFDVETDKRIVCSEIAFVVYHNVEWPTAKTMGRVTISPDNVAVQALDGGPFEPVVIYHAGKRIPDEQMSDIFPLLLQERYKELRLIMAQDRKGDQ